MHNIETRSQNFANGRHPWVPAKLSSYLYPCPSPRIFFSLVAWNGILYWSLLLLEDNLQIITYAELFLRSDRGHSPLSLTPLTISYRINRGSPAGRRCPQASMYDVRHSALVTRLHRKFVIQSTEKKTSPVVAGAMYWMSESVTDWMNEWMNEWMNGRKPAASMVQKRILPSSSTADTAAVAMVSTSSLHHIDAPVRELRIQTP